MADGILQGDIAGREHIRMAGAEEQIDSAVQRPIPLIAVSS